MRRCRICGQEGPEEMFATHGRRPDGTLKRRNFCKECYSRKESARNQRRDPGQLERLRLGGPVGDPVRFLFVGTLDRALQDVQAAGRAVRPTKASAMEDGVSQDPLGCDCDAKDALRWLTEYGEDWCELLDLPREWCRQAVEERLEANA